MAIVPYGSGGESRQHAGLDTGNELEGVTTRPRSGRAVPRHADQAARVLRLAAAVRVPKARLARTGVPPASIDRQIGVNRTAERVL
jgi:hypothetical protein